MRRFLVPLLLLALAVPQAKAHDGPPFPIVMDRAAGPFLVSVWTDPDVGTGTFIVILLPAPGTTLPEDLQVEVGVQPTSERLEMAWYDAKREPVRKRVQFLAEVPIDAAEMWRVDVRVRGGDATEVVSAEVEATPPGPARWMLALYLLPFILIGGMWALAVLRGRRGRPEERRTEK